MNKIKNENITIAILGRGKTGKTSAFTAFTHHNLATTKALEPTIENTCQKEIELSPKKRARLIDFCPSDKLIHDENKIQENIKELIEASDIILLMTDFNGLNNIDIETCRIAKSHNIPIIIVINKIDMASIPDDFLKKIKTLTPDIIFTSLRFDKDFVSKTKNKILKIFPEKFNLRKIIKKLFIQK